MIRGVLLDIAGVLCDGETPVPGAPLSVARLRAAGLRVGFLTNTTRQPKRRIVERLGALGIAARPEEVFTPAAAACAWLTAGGFSPQLLIHPDLAEDFADCPRDGPPAIVLGDAGDGFTYAALNAAFRAILGGAPFLALAANRVFRDADGVLSLDAGAFVHALEYASGQPARVLGKPAPDFFAAALAQLGCSGAEAAMVGDDAESDVAGALVAGLGTAILVRTGKYRPGDEARHAPPPSAVVEDIAAACAHLLAKSAG